MSVFIPQSDNNHYDEILLIDLNGKIVYQAAIANQEKIIHINTNSLVNGGYQCVLSEKNKTLVRQKFVKISQ